MPRIVLLTGTNLGDRARNIGTAEKKIESALGTVLQRSSVHESEPWGFQAAEKFLNQVLVVKTDLSPREALKKVLAIESEMGRQRQPEPENLSKVYTSRIIDIDILFYDDLIIREKELTVPHPLIAEREFVLTPLREVMPDFIHPVIGKKIKDL